MAIIVLDLEPVLKNKYQYNTKNIYFFDNKSNNGQCSWRVSFSCQFEKLGIAGTDEVTYVRCPICQTGRIIEG